MIRIVKTSNIWYGYEIKDVEYDAENIEGFAKMGSPVIIVDSLMDIEKNGLLVGEEIRMVED